MNAALEMLLPVIQPLVARISSGSPLLFEYSSARTESAGFPIRFIQKDTFPNRPPSGGVIGVAHFSRVSSSPRATFDMIARGDTTVVIVVRGQLSESLKSVYTVQLSPKSSDTSTRSVVVAQITWRRTMSGTIDVISSPSASVYSRTRFCIPSVER